MSLKPSAIIEGDGALKLIVSECSLPRRFACAVLGQYNPNMVTRSVRFWLSGNACYKRKELGKVVGLWLSATNGDDEEALTLQRTTAAS